MGKWKKLSLWLFGLLLLGLVIAVSYVLSISFSKDNTQLQNELASKGLDAEIAYYEYGNEKLRYVRITSKKKNAPLLVMIHGAPGSCGDFSSYLYSAELVRNFEIIAVDRPGYEQSNAGIEDVPIVRQAEILVDLLHKTHPGRKVALVSHSYGGPVGALMSIYLDSLSLGHVMVAPVMDAQSEKLFWYASVPLRWPMTVVSSFDWKIAAKEKLSHRQQLRELSDEWSRSKSPTIHIHGTADWLAPPENLKFCAGKFNPETYQQVVIDDGSHFILWDDDIRKVIIKRLVGLVDEY